MEPTTPASLDNDPSSLQSQLNVIRFQLSQTQTQLTVAQQKLVSLREEAFAREQSLKAKLQEKEKQVCSVEAQLADAVAQLATLGQVPDFMEEEEEEEEEEISDVMSEVETDEEEKWKRARETSEESIRKKAKVEEIKAEEIDADGEYISGESPMTTRGRWSRWSLEEDDRLRKSYEKHSREVSEKLGVSEEKITHLDIPWGKIALEIEGRTGNQCCARWTENLDPRVKKGKWDDAEDVKLVEGIKMHGGSWIQISEMIKGRTQRQCRARWMQIKVMHAELNDAPKVQARGRGRRKSRMFGDENETPKEKVKRPGVGRGRGRRRKVVDGEAKTPGVKNSSFTANGKKRGRPFKNPALNVPPPGVQSTSLSK